MKAIVNNSCCQIFAREKLTRGTVGKTMEAEFSDDWDGLAITAVIEAGDVKKDAVYTGDPIVIPHEVLATAGVSVMLGFHGALPDGTIVKRTEKEWINNVSETLDPAGVPSTEPTPDWTAQVQAIATEAKDVADSVRSDADAGKFTGPAGTDGGWYSPAITQPDANTMRVSFSPSKEGMPAVEPADIAIPSAGGSGASGADGGYYSPSVDADGNLSWTASKADMPAVDGANIKGPKGDTGTAGADGKSAYQYAQEGGYTGTEEDFAAKLAREYNPDAKTDAMTQAVGLDDAGKLWTEPGVGGESQAMTLLFDVQTTEEVSTILSGVNPAEYDEIVMFCQTVAADGKTTTYLDWIFGASTVRQTNSLHATQRRIHVFHAIKIVEGVWVGKISFGQMQDDIGSNNLSKTNVSGVDNVTVFYGNIQTNIGCQAYAYGGVNLAIGTILKVYGRKS